MNQEKHDLELNTSDIKNALSIQRKLVVIEDEFWQKVELQLNSTNKSGCEFDKAWKLIKTDQTLDIAMTLSMLWLLKALPTDIRKKKTLDYLKNHNASARRLKERQPGKKYNTEWSHLADDKTPEEITESGFGSFFMALNSEANLVRIQQSHLTSLVLSFGKDKILRTIETLVVFGIIREEKEPNTNQNWIISDGKFEKIYIEYLLKMGSVDKCFV